MIKKDPLAKLRKKARQYREKRESQEKTEKEEYKKELAQARKTEDIERVLIVMEKFGKIKRAKQRKVDWTKLISSLQKAGIEKILDDLSKSSLDDL